jgi:hypothetical protein
MPLDWTGPGMSWSEKGTRTHQGEKQWSGQTGPDRVVHQYVVLVEQLR